MVTAMNVDKLWPENISNSLTLLKAGHKFSVPEVMFAKITDEAREEMNEKFSGKK
jgi:methionyl-tRNA synthetase